MMRPKTTDIINLASAEDGKILITSDLIRLAFLTSDKAVRFLESIQEVHPDVNAMFVTKCMRKIDITNPELAA